MPLLSTPVAPPAGVADVNASGTNFLLTGGGLVVANLVFSAAATVPVGSQISDGTHVWTLLQAVVAGGAGTLQGLFQSVLVNGTAAATTLTTIVTPVTNWSSVTNPTASVSGAMTLTKLQAQQLGLCLVSGTI
jgi:hypothetical protein